MHLQILINKDNSKTTHILNKLYFQAFDHPETLCGILAKPEIDDTQYSCRDHSSIGGILDCTCKNCKEEILRRTTIYLPPQANTILFNDKEWQYLPLAKINEALNFEFCQNLQNNEIQILKYANNKQKQRKLTIILTRLLYFYKVGYQVCWQTQRENQSKFFPHYPICFPDDINIAIQKLWGLKQKSQT
ncbi:MAG: hypothetical protein LBC74_12725 [Planctomycetaceae bacterium]|jgi:hypothetical protein|nr:hypothetical protein [Planctomycetaceae bacterium]